MQYDITIETMSKELGLNCRYLYLLSNNIPAYYKICRIPKKNGKFRIIEAPAPILKRIQKYILRRILPVNRGWDQAKIAEFTNFLQENNISFDKRKIKGMMSAATAFESGCSVKDNASPHCGKNIIISLDVKDFFPSLRYSCVLELFKKYVWDDGLAVMFAKFCTLYGHLPQGAVSSPHISNLLLEEVDISLRKFCLTHNLDFTRYADDLTFSGDPSNEEITELIRLCRSELKQKGLKLNESKTRILRKGMRQEVTGLVVNSHLNAPREERRFLRQQMYYLNKFWEQKHQSFDEHSLNVLLGKINFIWDLNRANSEFSEYRKQLLEIKHYFELKRKSASVDVAVPTESFA